MNNLFNINEKTRKAVLIIVDTIDGRHSDCSLVTGVDLDLSKKYFVFYCNKKNCVVMVPHDRVKEVKIY